MARPIPLLAPVIMATLFMDINGKVALITGSAKRIRRDIALELARRGARLADGYRSSARGGQEVAGEVIWPGYLPYSVSKAALIAVNRGLAKAYAPNIQVNAIAPGPVLFPDYYTEEQKRSAIDRTLLKRAGSPRDIVNAVVFLIENDYITGEVIHVDGGRHIL